MGNLTDPATSLNGKVPRIVLLEGSPEEIGLAHGRILAGDIQFTVAAVHHHIFRRVGPARGPALRVVTSLLAATMGRYVPSQMKAEMRGIAAGSGASYLDILLVNTLDDVLNHLRRLAPPPRPMPSMGCSCFALLGRRCLDGMLLHGRNLDYHFRGTPIDDHGAMAKLMQKKAVLFALRPRDRIPFLSVGWPGMAGAVTAMNREGIALGNLTSYLPRTTARGVPIGFLYRRIVEEACTLKDAGRILRQSRRTIGNNLLVSSGREDDASLFELTRDVVLEITARGEGALSATNHFVSPVLAHRQRRYLTSHSVVRASRLRDLCRGDGLTVADALAFLGDTGDGDHACGPFDRIANEGTAVSVLFRPGALEMWMGAADEPPASRGAFHRIDAGSLLR